MDVGESLNPAIDIGQIEGAFIQGYGLFTMEEIKIRPDGIRLTRGPGNYKIPSADDAPKHFNVSLLGNSSNKMGIFSSKAIGEPPLFLGSCAFFAIRQAVRAYRIQNGNEVSSDISDECETVLINISLSRTTSCSTPQQLP